MSLGFKTKHGEGLGKVENRQLGVSGHILVTQPARVRVVVFARVCILDPDEEEDHV